MKLRRFAPTVAIAMTATLTLAACGDDNPTANLDAAGQEGGAGAEGEETAGGGELTGNLTGAGASAQESAQTAWIAGFQSVEPDVTVNYDSVGSGAGVGNMIAGGVDYAGSDAYLDEEQSEQVKEACGPAGAVNVPVYISPIAIPFNLEGVDGLNLQPATIAKIFNQEITTWNDPEIAQDNPDADLPDQPITVVNRSDESGTTENFTEYLAAAAGENWPHEPSNSWPVSGGEAAQQTQGVINVIQGTSGTIGYADASAAAGMSSASVGVGEDFVEFSPEAAAAVVDASEPADTGVGGDLAIDLAHDTEEAGAYPIVLVSYLVLCNEYEDAETADMVSAYAEYIVSEEGQDAAAEAAGSAPISSELREQALQTIGAINGG